MTRSLSILGCVISFLCLFGYGKASTEGPGIFSRDITNSKEVNEAIKLNDVKNIFATTTKEYECEKALCSNIYEPVCGSDAQSYYNRCLLECQSKPHITVVHIGKCTPFRKKTT